MDSDVRRLITDVQRLLREAAADASRSRDPLLAELGRELTEGRLTPRDALFGQAYRELFENRLSRVADYLQASPEERAAIAEEERHPPRPTTRDGTTDQDYFDSFTVLRGMSQ